MKLKKEILNKVWAELDKTRMTSQIDSDLIEEVVDIALKAINYIQCCVNKDLDKHPIEGINETMQTDTELEEVQLCGKSNCNRQKLEGNVYCSYHYDINFG